MMRLTLVAAALALCAAPAQAQPVEALTRFAQGDYAGAIAAADGSPASALMVGRSYAALGDHAAALDALGRADSTQALVLSATATELDALGRPAEAHRYVLRAFAADTTDARLAAAVGASSVRRREWDAAVAAFRASLRLRPSAATAEALGDAFTRAGRPADAVDALRQAVGIDSSRVSAVISLADALVASGNTGLGLSILFRAVIQSSASVELLRAQGRVAQAAGVYPLVAQSFGAALALSDSALVDRQGYGRGLVLSGQNAAAVPVLRRALALDPTHASTAYYLALALRDSDQPAEAVEAFDRAADLMGRADLAQLVWHRARARTAIDDHAGAVDDLELAAALAPPSPLLLLDLAVATEARGGRGDRALALDRFDAFLAIAGDVDASVLAFAAERAAALRARP